MRLMRILIIISVFAQVLSCQGRGRRGVAVKPSLKGDGKGKQQYEASIPVTFAGGDGKAVQSISLTNLVCDGIESYEVKSYEKSGDRAGTAKVSFFAAPKLSSLSCTELGVQTDTKDNYSAIFSQTVVAADGAFPFTTVALVFTQAGGGDDKKSGGTDTNTNNSGGGVTVDGEIKECPAGQKFDPKTSKCA